MYEHYKRTTSETEGPLNADGHQWHQDKQASNKQVTRADEQTNDEREETNTTDKRYMATAKSDIDLDPMDNY